MNIKRHIGLEKVFKELESFFDELIDNHKEFFKEEDTFQGSTRHSL
jgi:hypothetical protein